MMRDIVFYRKIFGNEFKFPLVEDTKDVVRIIDVEHIIDYEQKILNSGGNLTVPTVQLKDSQRIAYFSDPDGCIFALLENDH
ncbi:hypothetical protein EZV73_22450 [Acidaminobacter sp. JC074]|uniref:VOC family protein n=1 Tax=Acidaminobacter sp. JC074 TaxID=2530199 RepID=UPI001F1189FB|nr:hypothetical protein [Acidaminobacter sp. JC074]MCH4890361.1 hypothetical protein [Acidaminobacter sp. JC074]